MKRFSSLDVKTDGLLRVKRRTMVFTSQQKNSNSNEEVQEDEVFLPIITPLMNMITQT